MANAYYAVFNRQDETRGTPNDKRKAGKEGEITGNVEIARVVKLAAESVADAQETVRLLFPSNSSGTPVIITEAQYKES